LWEEEEEEETGNEMKCFVCVLFACTWRRTTTTRIEEDE